MKFMLFETNSLRALAEDEKGNFKWENIGTTAKVINLIEIACGKLNSATGKISYILPVIDESKANEFIVNAAQYGVTVQIVDEATARAKYDELMNQQIEGQ